MTQLVVLVEAAASGGGPAALLPYGDATVVEGLLARTDALGLGDPVILTRDEWLSDVERVLGGTAKVLPYRGADGAFAGLADLLAAGTGPLAVLHGEVMVHETALGGVLDHPRVATGVLSVPAGEGATLRTRGGMVASAGSAAHAVTDPDHAHLGVLRIDAADRPAAAAVARDAARLVGPQGWGSPDPVDVLTVGLVRRGVRVTAVPLGDYRWARPTSPEEAKAAADALASVDEARTRLRNAARPNDGFYSTFVVRRVSQHATAWALRKGWTPNQVTLASLAIGLVAAALFAVGDRPALIAGAVLLQASLVADCVDGEIARYRRRFTPLGAWLDGVSDRFKEYAAYAGLAIGAARSGDELWALAGATLALQVFRHTVDFGFAVRQDERRTVVPVVRLPLDRVGDLPDDPPGDGRPMAAPSRGLGHGAVRLSERTNRTSALVWAKRVVIMPIGERWLVISVTAALMTPRATFIALLALGAVAAAYTTTGRVLRSVADA